MRRDRYCTPYVGDTTVGKTALVQTFQSDGAQYPKNYSMVYMRCTHGVCIYVLISVQTTSVNLVVKTVPIDEFTSVVSNSSSIIFQTFESAFFNCWFIQCRSYTCVTVLEKNFFPIL